MKLQTHQPASDRDLTDIMHAGLVVAAGAGASAPRLSTADVRVLELLSQRAGESRWQRYADSYLRAWWVRFVIANELGQLLSIAC